MDLAANALIDVSYLQAFAEVPEGDETTPDDTWILYINAASQLIENWCCRKFIANATDITEIFDGDGSHEHYVRNGRVTATPTIKYWNSTAFTTTTYTSTYDSTTGRVYFTDGNVFDRGKDNWQISYKYGWARASLPEDIKMACAALAQHLRATAKNSHLNSQSFGDSTTSYNHSTMPDMVRQVVDRYRVMTYA